MDTTEPEQPSSPPRQAKARRVPPGWVAPGPAGSAREVALAADEVLSWLLGDWRIIQRKDGHRWSLDDLLTAWVARQTATSSPAGLPGRILDLGSGIGSVALMLAWCFPGARVTGVEAQEVSHRLALRSAHANEVEGRVRFVRHDLRRVLPDVLEPGAWDLVTGTPPYFDDPRQTRSHAIQKGPCRFEQRGGVADYLAAMRLALAPSARAVVCHASRQRARVLDAISAAGFVAERCLEAVPKRDRAPLVDVFVLAADAPNAASAALWERLVVRDRDDQWTPEFLALRLSMGMPPRP